MEPIARSAIPSASDQNPPPPCISSTTRANRHDEFLELLFADDQRRCDLEDHKVIAADLGQNPAGSILRYLKTNAVPTKSVLHSHY